MKRPLLVLAMVFSCGVAVGEQAPLPLPWLYATSLVFAVACLAWPLARRWGFWPLVMFTGWTHIATSHALLSPVDLRVIPGKETAYVRLRGQLIETPFERRQGFGSGRISQSTLARIETEELEFNGQWRPAQGRVAVSMPGLLPPGFYGGRRIEVAGVIRPPSGPLAEGLFDYRAYLRRNDIYHQLRAQSPGDWCLLDPGQLSQPPPLADRFQAWARETLSRGLPEDDAVRLTWAMALGWKTALTDEVSEPFMRSGTMHVFAISGLHIALIAGILVSLLRFAQIPRPVCGGLVIPLIWAYTAVTGWQASAIRSTLMMTFILLGWSLKRPSDLVNSLGGAALLILLWDPGQLFQAGFQLSFVVVLSLALLMPRFESVGQRLFRTDPMLPEKLRPPWRRRLDAPARYVSLNFATSVAAWLGSVPLIAWYFHLFTPASLLSNLVVVPLSGLALTSNLGSLLCGSPAPGVGELFNFSGWFWMDAMNRISGWSARLPGAYWHVSAPAVGLVALYYGLLYGLMSGWLLKGVWRIRITALATALCGVWFWLHVFQPPSATATLLPLHGGEAIHLSGAAGTGDVLIDCGNASAAASVVRPFLRARGVDRIGHLILTHGDIRHVGGAGTILRDFAVGDLVTGGQPFRSATYRQTLDLADHAGIKRRQLGRGDVLGPWTVLHPAANDRFSRADDAALVLKGEVKGTRILLCSDLGRAGQTRLIECESDLEADVVMAGIPQGGEPLCDALLDRVRPRIILLSESEQPATARAGSELRDRLNRRRIPVLYTSETGAVTLEFKDSGLQIRTLRDGYASTELILSRAGSP